MELYDVDDEGEDALVKVAQLADERALPVDGRLFAERRAPLVLDYSVVQGSRKTAPQSRGQGSAGAGVGGERVVTIEQPMWRWLSPALRVGGKCLGRGF